MSFDQWWAKKRIIRCDENLRVHVDDVRNLVREAHEAGAEESASRLNRYVINGIESQEVLQLDSRAKPVDPPTEYSIEVSARTAEDAWFMHARNVETQRVEQRMLTPKGSVWRSMLVPKYSPRSIEALR